MHILLEWTRILPAQLKLRLMFVNKNQPDFKGLYLLQVTFSSAEMVYNSRNSFYFFVTCKQHLEVSGGLRWLWFSYIGCANTPEIKPLKEKSKKIRQSMS